MRAGVPATAIRKMLSEDRYKAMVAGGNGTRTAFLQAILKRAPKDYHAHLLPAVDDAAAERSQHSSSIPRRNTCRSWIT